MFDAQSGIASKLHHRRTPPRMPGLPWIIRTFNAFALPRTRTPRPLGINAAQVRRCAGRPLAGPLMPSCLHAARRLPRADTSIKALLGRAERARYKANVNTSRPRRGPPPCPSAGSSPSGPRPVHALPSVTGAIQHRRPPILFSQPAKSPDPLNDTARASLNAAIPAVSRDYA
jgi:hypothetical protein